MTYRQFYGIIILTFESFELYPQSLKIKICLVFLTMSYSILLYRSYWWRWLLHMFFAVFPKEEYLFNYLFKTLVLDLFRFVIKLLKVVIFKFCFIDLKRLNF